MYKLISAGILLALITSCGMTQQIKKPQTAKVNQVDNYFGTQVSDPYRWLEDDTSKATMNWVDRQIDYTEAHLSQIPFRNKIKKQLTEIWNYPKQSAPYQRGEYITYYKNNGLQNQSVLYYKTSHKDIGQVLLDPNSLSKDGTAALSEVRFSRNERYLAYALSKSGSDWAEIFVKDVESDTLLSDKLEYVKFTSITWKGDEGFYYAGYEPPTNDKIKYSAKTESQKIYFHKVGTPQSEDLLIYEDKEHPLRYVGAYLTEDERFLCLQISEGTDGSEIKIKDMRNPRAGFSTIVKGFNTNASIITNDGDKLLVLTNENAPNYKLVAAPIHDAIAGKWQIVIPESAEPLSSVSTAGGKLFANYLKDANTKIVQYNIDGSGRKEVKLPGIGTAGGFSAEKKAKELYYTFTSFTTPATVYKFDIASGVSSLYQKSQIKFNSNDYETKQVFYTSKDGTKVPMFITYKKGIKLDGTNPTLLYAYGGFNISIKPSFSVARTAILENGGIYAVANIRGGSEYGEQWHKEGMLDQKQNVFDDFIAAAEYLIKNKYTSSDYLAIDGRSNGGLLVGAVMTQRPDLYKVCFPQVGVLDMLRYHKFTVGWGWAVEYGSSDYKDQFNYLIKYSPLHNVKNSCYPATMITTADHDDRVVPAHSFKFGATLQEKQKCKNPVLIRIDKKAGHGAGKPTSMQIQEAADIASFMFYNMGIKL